MLASTAVGMMDSSVLGPLEGYTGSSAGALGMALLLLGEQLDGAAANLTDENASLRRLFEGSAARVGGDLGARLSQASRAPATISATISPSAIALWASIGSPQTSPMA